MSTPEEITVVINDLQRWRSVRERINELKPKKHLDTASLTRAIALLLEYRVAAWAAKRQGVK